MNQFENTALQVPREYRGVQTTPVNSAGYGPIGHYYFGIPSLGRQGVECTDEFPLDMEGVSFFLGKSAIARDLLSSFVRSGYPENIKRLSIGNSSFRLEGSSQWLGEIIEYAEIVAQLNGTVFPELTEFHLGVSELFSNSERLHYTLGDVTGILANCPKLETLGLYGDFEINQSYDFDQLRELTVMPTDGFDAEQRLHQRTLDNLLNSDFPLLEYLFIDSFTKDACERDDDGIYQVAAEEIIYTLPKKILEEGIFPNLKSIEICGEFAIGEKQRLLASDVCRRLGANCFLDDMVEVYR